MAWPLEREAEGLLTRDHGVTARIRSSVNRSPFVVPLQLEQPGGAVKIDGGSFARRSLDCTVVSTLSSPAVDPLSAEVRAEYGLVDHVTHRTWWVPVGTFVITDAVDAGSGRVKLTGVDRWQRIVDARFERPVTTSGDTVAAIVSLLTGADSRIVVDTTHAIPGQHGAALWDRDRADAIVKLARSSGNEVYFDQMGIAVVRGARSLSDPPAWQIGRGKGGARVSVQRGVSRGRTYNAVAVKAEPQGAAPMYAVARITTGPLRWGGPFGRRTRFYSTSLPMSQQQVQSMADGLLAAVSGVARTLDIESLPNPALDAGDVLQAEVAPAVWQRHMLQATTLPLGLGTTPLATRTAADEDETGD